MSVFLFHGLELRCDLCHALTRNCRVGKYSCSWNRLKLSRLLEGASTKKHGVAQSEIELFEDVAATCGLLKRSGAPKCWSRHPLAFLVEAADDICYRII